MDEYVIRHLNTWLNEQFREDEGRDDKRGKILVFVTEYPDLLERMSWWEILELAERESVNDDAILDARDMAKEIRAAREEV